MYKVIKFFTDLHDADYPYSVGDTFPRPGVTVSAGRIAELSGSNNKQNTPLIQFVEDEPAPPIRKRAKKNTAE